MKTKNEHINYWLSQANDDWEAVETLIKGKKFLQALFFTHLVIEKICKALWIKHNETNIPPKTHNLLYLLSKTPTELSAEQSEFLLNLNRFQLEGRYPEYVSDIKKISDEKLTFQILKQAEELKSWLIEKLQ